MTKSKETADLLTLTEEIVNAKLQFLCSVTLQNMKFFFEAFLVKALHKK